MRGTHVWVSGGKCDCEMHTHTQLALLTTHESTVTFRSSGEPVSWEFRAIFVGGLEGAPEPVAH